jgi:histidinol-phosphate aminotransferase
MPAAEPDFEALAQPGIRGLRAYDPGHDVVALRQRFGPDLVELGSNENPFGCSPLALDAAREALALAHRYPDPLGMGLKRAISARLDWPVEGIVLGNGSHELLMQFAQVFAGPDAAVLASRHGFAVYGLAAKTVAAPLLLAESLPLSNPMPLGHDLDALVAACTPQVRLCYLCNPSNPIGTWFEPEVLENFLQRIRPDVVVVLDEAYIEYRDPAVAPRSLDLLRRHPNLVLARTFSKIHGLAGLRVGYALAHTGIVALVERLRESFNVNAAGLAAAEAALGDEAHVSDVRQRTSLGRLNLTRELRNRGYKVYPSATNFLLVEFGEDTADIEAVLVEQGVILRPMGGYGLPQCLRITIGAPAEKARLLAALDGLRA